MFIRFPTGVLGDVGALSFMDDSTRQSLAEQLQSVRNRNRNALEKMMELSAPYAPFSCRMDGAAAGSSRSQGGGEK